MINTMHKTLAEKLCLSNDKTKTRSTGFSVNARTFAGFFKPVSSRIEQVWRRRKKNCTSPPKDAVDGSPVSPGRVKGQTDTKKQHQE